jgi:hypothetical protein
MAVSRCFENYVYDHRADEDRAFLPIRHHGHELSTNHGNSTSCELTLRV